MRKRLYILLVTRDSDGELKKIPIPLHYLYVFLAGALIGMFTVTGMAGSYTRMVMKVARFNQLRTEKQALESRYEKLERVAQEKELQVASLGSLASEVSVLYGLKTDPVLTEPSGPEFTDEQFATSLDRLYQLKTSAMSGATSLAIGFNFGPRGGATVADWLQLAAAPHLWPVEGRVTGSFGERRDPFNGEGAFHSGVDISSCYGCPVVAPAAGIVLFADTMAGYGRMVVLMHGNNISTRFGHMSGFAVIPGQSVRRGDVIGYVGLSGRSTGPHVHYEVRILDAPVNPYKYLRTTLAHSSVGTGDSGS
ncbi:MAG TPA: M23 family metallopeptidase [Terriglobales bacterium]|nr:M23 family metallopeptidase [Terriglobales bacterium]